MEKVLDIRRTIRGEKNLTGCNLKREIINVIKNPKET